MLAARDRKLKGRMVVGTSMAVTNQSVPLMRKDSHVPATNVIPSLIFEHSVVLASTVVTQLNPQWRPPYSISRSLALPRHGISLQPLNHFVWCRFCLQSGSSQDLSSTSSPKINSMIHLFLELHTIPSMSIDLLPDKYDSILKRLGLLLNAHILQ